MGLLQAALLPATPSRLGPVATSAAYRPADGPGAGGDFYDLFALDDGQLGIIVGDLSGHGRLALPHTALVRFTLRAYLEAGLSPRNVLQTAASVLERQLGDSFATVVVATYHPRARVLVYACAGHPPPIVIGSQPITPLAVCCSPPIGAGLATGTRQTTVELPGESLVCFYTDGVTDARIGTQFFGTARLEHTLDELGPDVTASAVLDNVSRATDRRPDDMAACLLRITGDRSRPSIRTEELALDRAQAVGDMSERFLAVCGIDPDEIVAVVRAARASVARAGTVVLKVRFRDGVPEVTMRQRGLALVQLSAHQAASAS